VFYSFFSSVHLVPIPFCNDMLNPDPAGNEGRLFHIECLLKFLSTQCQIAAGCSGFILMTLIFELINTIEMKKPHDQLSAPLLIICNLIDNQKLFFDLAKKKLFSKLEKTY